MDLSFKGLPTKSTSQSMDTSRPRSPTDDAGLPQRCNPRVCLRLAGGLPETHIGTFPDALMAQAKKDGWVAISMQKDWKHIFSFEKWAEAASDQCSMSDLWATLAWMVVPFCGCDSMDKFPFRSLRRSFMLTRPSPRLALVASTSKPRPLSLIVR
jgi:hypothetical protein